MATTNSRRLDRKKFLGDPVLVVTIVILVVFLALFILYPLAMLLVDSVYEQTTGITVSVFGRVLGMNRFRTAFFQHHCAGVDRGLWFNAAGTIVCLCGCICACKKPRHQKAL